MAPEPVRRTLTELVDLLGDGALSSVDLVAETIDRADRVGERLGLFQTRYDERALAAAEAVDGRRAAGEDVGVLAGVPLAIKDLIATADGPTTGGSLLRDPVWSEPRDGAAMARLRAADGIVFGKSVTSELGVGSPDPDKPFPMPRNPWDETRWTGGSSAGTAAAIAAGVVGGGLGTDSGGSIRMPAAFCGVTGLKPTYGLVPKDRVVPMGWSTDHVGPLAVTARDCALLLGVVAGPTSADSASAQVPAGDYLAALTGSLGGVRVGVDRMHRIGGAVAHPQQPALFDAALNELTALGADLVEVELPHYERVSSAAIVTTLSEALAYHGDRLAARWADFFNNTRTTVGLAAYFTGADYVQAQRVRRLAVEAVDALFADVDLVVMPTAAVAATPYDRLDVLFESGEFFAIYSGYWNMVGNPSLSVPVGFTDEGLPMAMQLAGPRFDEATVLRAGDAYQQRTDWHRRSPSSCVSGGAELRRAAPAPDSRHCRD